MDQSAAWLSLYGRSNSRLTIYVAANCKEAADRFELSNGTRLADISEISESVHGAAYEEGARLPREPWRRPNAEEAQRLIATKAPRNMAGAIAIVRLPDGLSNKSCAAIRNVTSETLERELLQPLRTICELGEPLQCLGANVNRANLKTVTVNREIARFIGLHVDSWDRLDIHSLHLATNRICMNVGNGDRYFLFVPISLMDMASLLAEEGGPDWQTPRRYTEIGRQFMARFPDMPVLRCRIAPGEAYIAPTENLVHDGSSLGQSDSDEQFTIRGHIRPL